MTAAQIPQTETLICPTSNRRRPISQLDGTWIETAARAFSGLSLLQIGSPQSLW
jgi:hypothetical protein